MRFETRVRGFGIAVAALGIPAFLLVQPPAGPVAAGGLVVLGAFVAFVVAERAVPADGVEALLHGGSRPLDEVARGLHLKGRPVLVPDRGDGTGERLFLPTADDSLRVPVLDVETVAYVGTDTAKNGVAVTPPGRALVDGHAAAAGADLHRAPIQEAEAFLRGLTDTYDLARDIRLGAEGEALRLRFRKGAVKPPCFENPGRPACERMGCAVCQSAACVLARSLQRPLEVLEARVDPPWVRLDFRLLEEEWRRREE